MKSADKVSAQFVFFACQAGNTRISNDKASYFLLGTKQNTLFRTMNTAYSAKSHK